jgi:hypothetical protein
VTGLLLAATAWPQPSATARETKADELTPRKPPSGELRPN